MRLLLIILGAAAGYVTGASAGYWLVDALSPNTHDRAVEAAMSAAFVFGPLGAIIGAVWARTRQARKTR